MNSPINDVISERARQDAKWGGASHDDHHTVAEFVQLIEDYAGWARTMAGMDSHEKARNRLIQVAALAVAACEYIDRNHFPASQYGLVSKGKACLACEQREATPDSDYCHDCKSPFNR